MIHRQNITFNNVWVLEHIDISNFPIQISSQVQRSHRYWKIWYLEVVMGKSWNINDWHKVMDHSLKSHGILALLSLDSARFIPCSPT